MIKTRMTKQRRIILSVLRDMKTHPTAEDIYTLVRKQLPNVSLGTVYRNLDFLLAQGDVIQINSTAALRRFDGDISDHWHMHCMSCGAIVDVKMDAIPSDFVQMDKIKDNSGFSIKKCRIEFDGYCEACKAN